MKRFLPLLAALSLALGACAQAPHYKTNYVPPSTVPVRQSVDRASEHATKVSTSLAAASASAKAAREQIAALERAAADSPPLLKLAQDLNNKVDDLTAALLAANTENEATKTELVATQQLAQDLQVKVDKQTDLLNTTSDNLNKAIEQGAVDKKHAHEYKWALIGLAAAATGFLVFAIFGAASIAPPLLYVLLGAPAAVSTFLFFWLGSG